MVRGRMRERQAAGVERDCGSIRRCRRKWQPSPVTPVSHDRASPAGQLDPQLVPPTGRWQKFDQRHLPQSFDDPGTNMALVTGHRLVGIIEILSLIRDLANSTPRGAESRSALLAETLQPIVPFDPFTKRRRKSPLDHGLIRLLDRSFSKLP